jgi:hypothetical protein
MITTQSKPGFTLVTLILPGPDRKRSPSPYHFQIVYRNPDPEGAGCVATWEVRGGREEYQISLERTEEKGLHWHCCCPDAVYREDSRPNYQCKHVRGLVQGVETINIPVYQKPMAA